VIAEVVVVPPLLLAVIPVVVPAKPGMVDVTVIPPLSVSNGLMVPVTALPLFASVTVELFPSVKT
jgi:hypothetical protein